MNVSEVLVKRVLGEIDAMLSPDGGSCELVSLDGEVAKVRYVKGHNDRCIECVMPPDEFRLYLLDVLQERVKTIGDVEIVEIVE